MGRNKLYNSNSERQKHYRKSLTKEQRQAAGNLIRLLTWKKENPERAKQSTIQRNLQRRRDERLGYPFIAIDGEGTTRLKNHYYTMLSSSEGHTIEDWDSGLSTERCLSFLHQYAGKGFLVGFYTTYDVNMMLRDVELETLRELWDKGETIWYPPKYDGKKGSEYHLQWNPGKRFQIRHKGKQVVWYDVFGFFQKGFVKALVDWKLAKPELREVDGKPINWGDKLWDSSPTHKQKVVQVGCADWYMLTESKDARSSFKKGEREKIKRYNLRECELLVSMMNKLRSASIEAGYCPTAWHGAGALANTILKANGVHNENKLDLEMRPRFLEAYYGGRNQVLQQGEFDIAYGHDINSAYPYALTMLPTSQGSWKKVDGRRLRLSDNPFTLYKVDWKTPKTEFLNPFPFRFKGGIFWPNKGCGYYWQPEVAVAMEHYARYTKILEVWEFTPDNQIKPFEFIHTLFDTRRRFLATDNDAQIILKLGMNSCYGKVAQSIGYKGQPPPYQNYFWAGYITSVTRAEVLRLALKSKESVISFATDGVIASEKLTDHNLTKQLGTWSVEEIENLFVLQPGVYCYDGSNHKTTIKSRGFSYRSVDYNTLRTIWREFGVLGNYSYSETRFIGLGSALQSSPPLKNWRRWIRQERQINFNPNGLTTLQTGKTLRVFPHYDKGKLSEAYKAKELWLPDADFVSDLEQ